MVSISVCKILIESLAIKAARVIILSTVIVCSLVQFGNIK